MERRKENRIKLRGDSFVTNMNSKKSIGRIVDISRNGLAFHYLNTASIPGNFSYELGIWLKEPDLYLPNILTNTVSDFQVDYTNPYMHIPLRRRSVQFCGLTLGQNAKLNSAFCSLLPNERMSRNLNYYKTQIISH